MEQLRGGLTEWLQQRIKATGLSHAQLAKEAKVSQPQISKFMNAGTTLNLSTVDRLLPHVDRAFYERVDKLVFEQKLFEVRQAEFERKMMIVKQHYEGWATIIESLQKMLAVAETISSTMTPEWEDEFWEDMNNRIDVPDPDTPPDQMDDLFYAMRQRDRKGKSEGA